MLQRKYFPKQLITLPLVLIFGGCISFSPPYQQIRYSDDSELNILKEKMNKEEAVDLLRIHIKDNAEAMNYLYPTLGLTIEEKSVRRDTIVNEESISYHTTYSLGMKENNPTLSSTGKHVSDNSSQSSFEIKYQDVKKIKLYAYQEIFYSYYKIYLYDNTNKAIFQFSLPCNNEGNQNANKLLAGLSVLIPHAEEEYNEDDTHMYTNPMPFLR